MQHRTLLGRSMLIVIVLTAYNFFYSPMFLPAKHYSYLTQGFLAGQLSLSILPNKRVLNSKDPYDPAQNKRFKLHDASLYKGKYYLYFGPLPVIAFYIPFKLLTGSYPPESSSVIFFLSAGFLIGFILLMRIKDKYFQHIPEFHLIFSGLIFGLVSTAPFLLARPSFYEAAISSAFCFMMLALFFLYELLTNSLQIKNVFLFSLCLSLTVSGRPHFALVCLALISGVFIYLLKVPSNNRRGLIYALLFPTFCAGVILSLYNYLRFDSFFEFGQRFQLAGFDPRQYGILDLSNIFQNLTHGLFYYFFQPFFFPLLIPIHEKYLMSPTCGILLTTPFIILIFLLPKLVIFHFKNGHQEKRPLFIFLIFLFIIPLILILFLCIIPRAANRYEMDFSPYLIFLSIMTLWLLDGVNLNQRLLKLIYGFFITTGVMGIFIQIVLYKYAKHYFIF